MNSKWKVSCSVWNGGATRGRGGSDMGPIQQQQCVAPERHRTRWRVGLTRERERIEVIETSHFIA
jgi:hypothetical protein